MRSVALIAALLFVSVESPAMAEESAEDQARSLFEQGLRALEHAQYIEARDFLNRSIELFRHQATIFNLAVALRGTGETRASIELIDEILDGHHGELTEERLAQARESREASMQDLATLRIRAEGAPEIEIRVDGELVARVGDGEQTERLVDSGTLLVTASAPGYSSAERRVSLERGGEASVSFRVERVAPTPTNGGQEASPAPREPISRRPWFWAVLGVGFAVVIAAIVTSVVLTGPENGGLEADPVFGRVTYTLSE